MWLPAGALIQSWPESSSARVPVCEHCAHTATGRSRASNTIRSIRAPRYNVSPEYTKRGAPANVFTSKGPLYGRRKKDGVLVMMVVVVTVTVTVIGGGHRTAILRDAWRLFHLHCRVPDVEAFLEDGVDSAQHFFTV